MSVIRLAIPGTLAGSLALILLSTGPASGQEQDLELERSLETRTLTWTDVTGEVGYHVFGEVVYWPPPSCINRLDIPGETVEFDETLAADATTYQLPPPNDPRLSSTKEVVFTIEAVDADGIVLARDGFGLIGDNFCTDEQIAAELAAAGTGFEPDGWPLAPVAALVAIAGAGLTTAGVLLRRRAG